MNPDKSKKQTHSKEENVPRKSLNWFEKQAQADLARNINNYIVMQMSAVLVALTAMGHALRIIENLGNGIMGINLTLNIGYS